MGEVHVGPDINRSCRKKLWNFKCFKWLCGLFSLRHLTMMRSIQVAVTAAMKHKYK
jgi:hypothetical protein